MKINNILLGALLCASASYATEPSGYYDKCEGKNGASLLSALNGTVNSHTTVSYDGLYNVYKTSDVDADGKLWDMYSTKRWTFGNKQCGNYSAVGDCYNREHSVPQSWFSSKSPMKSDAFHVYPTDGKVNGQRSNYPYGECANGTTLSASNGIKALGRLGACTFPGYSGTVFEPDDEYKGDFARTYFYMAAAYNGSISGWNGASFAGNAYPGLSSWAIELFLKWHRQDPVSPKELDRNDAVYAYQKNRNPFIDHPEMAEYIWGNKKTETWSYAAASQAAFALPVSGTTIDLGTTGVGVKRSTAVAVKSSGLTNPVTVKVSGSGFSVNTSTITAASANAGTTINVTYTPTAVGTASGTLTLTSGDLSVTVTLTASAVDGLPATAPTNVSDDSFTAHWSYVGDEFDGGYYRLYVKDIEGNDVDTYPRSVKASDETYVVDELDAETSYTYYIASKSLVSNTISVTTGAPIPSIQFLYAGDLNLDTAPGEPSAVAEITLEVDNIDGDITLSVTAPFELSSDKASWGQSLIVSPLEDRFYLRVYSDVAGVFTTDLTAHAGTYTNDETELTAIVSSTPTFIEDFEKAYNGTYLSSGTVEGTACTWNLNNAGVYAENKAHGGQNYLRMGKNATSTIDMASDKAGGIGTVTLHAAGWSASDGETRFKVQYSTDGGKSWTDTPEGEVKIDTPASSTPAYAPYSFTVNTPGNVRLRIAQTYGQRWCLDDIEATDCKASGLQIDGLVSDPNAWDAYCRDGLLCLDLSNAANVAVHGIDGITYHRAAMAAGTHTLSLPAGLYIIVVDDFSRRVLVK